jgi:hypothetical protein
MDFEKECRKWAYERVKRGDSATLAEALIEAETDSTLYSMFFITPFSLGNHSKSSSSGGEPLPKAKAKSKGKGDKDKGKPTKWDKQWGKAKGDKNKDKDKDAGKGKGVKYLNRTEENLMICFSYNNKDHGCKGNCGMEHVCRICLGPHPTFECPKKGKGKGKQE